MRRIIGPLLAVLTMAVAGVAPARAQDIKNYSWSATSTPEAFPPTYKDSSGTPIPTYAIANGRLRAASTGSLGAWVGKQFDWPMTSALANNERVNGSLKFRINGLENNGNAAANRIRLFQFNAPWANGLPALFTLMGSDSTVDLGPGNWRPGGNGDWNKWELNPNTTGAKAPAGKTYVYNSFNMSNPAKDPDYCRLVDNGVDHVLTWSAQYEESCDAVKVSTALDGVAWTVTYVARHWPDWLLGGGWTENALAKAWPNMGAWDAEFSEIKWATTTTAPSDVKNYEWNGLSGSQPPGYKDSSGTPIPTYDANWKTGSLRAASTGSLGAWVGKQFDWPMTSALANDQYITGRLVFRIDGLENNGNAAANRIRLFQFNAPWANGLPALFTLMGSDSTVDLGPGNWRPGGNGDWNKWELNPNTTGAKAPAGKTYVYNSFNMNNPATDADYSRLIDNGVDHVLTWTAQYAECDIIRVTTVLDGVPWTSTDIGRQYPDWLLGGGWTENALAKAWPNMGAWDVTYSALSWKTQSGAPLPCPPTLGISTLSNGELEIRWSAGSLYESSDFNGTWTKVEASSPYKTTSAGARRFYRAVTP